MTTPLEQEQADAILAGVAPEPGAPKELPLFFLRTLTVEGFRSLEQATFNFQPGLNVIIGANNAAKSAVIDALRLIFNLGTFENKEDFIKLRPTDVFLDATQTPDTHSISFTATFYGRSESDVTGQFLPLICPGEVPDMGDVSGEYTVFKLLYRADYSYNKSKMRYEYVRSIVKGGETLTNPVDHDVLDNMRSIYLAPLRDLLDDRARVGAEIERLIFSHTAKGKEDERALIPDELRDKARELIERITGNKHQDAAGQNLSQYAKPYGIPEGSLSFLPSGISDSLFGTMWPVFAHGLHGSKGLPLSSNGLGINQLIYASIVLSRRGSGESDDQVRKFFLIEEPEAHLHPQLQDSFFHALNQITDHQLFVTSHSPTITAKTSVEKIIVMRRSPNGQSATPLHLAEAFAGKDDDKDYLHKFLDVTRSQLLFARGAVFVEGVTEAMLMQHFSDIIGHSLRDSAIEIVVVDSDEGFDHFRPLFEYGGNPYFRAVFITDGDEDPATVKSDAEILSVADKSFDRMDINGSTAVATGYGTFEFGLLRAAAMGIGNPGMQALLSEAMKKAAPPPVKSASAEAAFVSDFMDFEHPALSYQKMKEKKASTVVDAGSWHGSWTTNGYFKKAKSNFAFYLEKKLDELGIATAVAAFTVPRYIAEAIEFVTAEPEEQEPASGTDN